MQHDTFTGNAVPSAKSKLDLLIAAARRRRDSLMEPLRGVAEDERETVRVTWPFRQSRPEYSALND